MLNRTAALPIAVQELQNYVHALLLADRVVAAATTLYTRAAVRCPSWIRRPWRDCKLLADALPEA
eukprot:944560-Alexandrium_andersonii.AAC.1